MWKWNLYKIKKPEYNDLYLVVKKGFVAGTEGKVMEFAYFDKESCLWFKPDDRSTKVSNVVFYTDIYYPQESITEDKVKEDSN